MAHKIFTESSDGFLNLRWNYSPLKEKAVPLPGGLFVCDESSFKTVITAENFAAMVAFLVLSIHVIGFLKPAFHFIPSISDQRWNLDFGACFSTLTSGRSVARVQGISVSHFADVFFSQPDTVS